MPDPEDPEEFELIAAIVWWIPELNEFVSHEDEEFLGELKEVVDVWFEGGGGAKVTFKIIFIQWFQKWILIGNKSVKLIAD